MSHPEFGNKLDRIDYIDRPGSYAVIENSHKQIAVIETENGCFLPGGGIDADETEVDALKRELIEEIGYSISGIREMGMAVEYIKASQEEKYYRIQSTFFQAQLESRVGEGSEADHHLVWLPPELAIKLLIRQSQVWAVQSLAKE